jgi:hypothetical protein
MHQYSGGDFSERLGGSGDPFGSFWLARKTRQQTSPNSRPTVVVR